MSEAVRSVLAQDHRNLQVILVDDGSTDGTGELCDAFARTDGRVRVIHQEHRAVAAARNAGVEAARGEWIAFVGSDDVVGTSYLRVLLDAAVGQGVDIAIAQVARFADDPPAALQASCADVKVISGREACATIYTREGFLLDALWGKMYRRTLFETLRFPAGKTSEDAFVMHELLWPQERVALCMECYYGYRNNPAGIMSKRSIEQSFDSLDALEARIAFYDRVGDGELAEETRKLLAWWRVELCAKAAFAGRESEAPARWRMTLPELLDVLAGYAHEPQANRLLGKLLVLARIGRR